MKRSSVRISMSILLLLSVSMVSNAGGFDELKDKIMNQGDDVLKDASNEAGSKLSEEESSFTATDSNGSNVPEVWDIRGVRLGMDALAVEKTMQSLAQSGSIEKHLCSLQTPYCYSPNTQQRFLDKLGPNPYVSRLEMHGKEKIVAYFLAPPGAQQAAYIYRSRKYSIGEQPNVETMISALQDKYGEPSHIYRQATSMHLAWEVDIAGAPIPEPRFNNFASPFCSIRLSLNDKHLREVSYFSHRERDVPCDYSLRTRIGFTKDGLITGITTTLIDVNRIIDRVAQTREYVSRRNQDERRRQLEDAKANEPEL